MEKKAYGRLDRKHYWLALVGLLLLKYGMIILTGKWLIILELPLGLIVLARFHDFGAPSWIGAVLWMVIAFALPHGAGMFKEAAEFSDAFVGFMVIFSWLFYVVAGFIPGNAEANQYGPPDQGFSIFDADKVKAGIAAHAPPVRAQQSTAAVPLGRIGFGKRS
jgi:uncharacterized membrane protein YhaH (DUF805 family)